MATLTVSVVTANNKKLILDCLASVYANADGIVLETYVVINASSDDSAAAIGQQFPQVKLIVNDEKRGFTHNHNMVMRRATGDYFLVLNDDTVILESAITRMVKFMEESPEVGILGCRIRNADGSLQWSCGASRSHKWEFFRAGVLRSVVPKWPVRRYGTIREVTWVTGACLLARAEAAERVGLLDENIVIYFEDGDWCYRMIKNDWKVVFYPDAEIVHYHGQTRKKNLARDLFIIYQSRLYFFAKHCGWLLLTIVRAFTLLEVSMRLAKCTVEAMVSKTRAREDKDVRRTYLRVMRMAFARAASLNATPREHVPMHAPDSVR